MPADNWRTTPARNSSLCETTSASAGSSRRVGIKYCDQRIEKHFRLEVERTQPTSVLEYRLQSGFRRPRKDPTEVGTLNTVIASLRPLRRVMYHRVHK